MLAECFGYISHRSPIGLLQPWYLPHPNGWGVDGGLDRPDLNVIGRHTSPSSLGSSTIADHGGVFCHHLRSRYTRRPSAFGSFGILPDLSDHVHFFHALPSRERGQRGASTQLMSSAYEHAPAFEKWLFHYRRVSAHIIGFTAVLMTWVFSFEATELAAVLHPVRVMMVVSGLISLRMLYLMARYGGSRSLVLWLICALPMAYLSRGLWDGALSEAILLIYFSVIYGYLMSQSPVMRDSMESFQSAPAFFVLLSFALLIFLGTLWLSQPAALIEGAQVDFMSSLFTAVSAACVTGLSVVNIAQTYSGFGQLVLLILIQVGGLGIMVLSTFATIAFGGRLGVRTEKAFSEFFSQGGMKSTHQLIVFIVIATVLIEICGAAGLSYYHVTHQGMEIGEAVKLGIFQAISAFCNAGFSLTEDSLSHLSGSPGPLIIYGILIVLGGLGFVVLFELVRALRSRRSFRLTLSMQTKIVLMMSTILVVGGAGLFAVLEWGGEAYEPLSAPEKILNSFFHSVTLRTAGFHTIAPDLFSYPSMVVMFALMFVGGAPGGTAGGVKVTTLAALLATLPTLLRNDHRVTFFSRRFSMQIIAKSSALIILSGATIGGLWFLLLLTQEGDPVALLFEVFSATGTVGITLGVTSQLDLIGQMIITLGMFVGRIGPLTLAIALAHDERSRIDYPSAEIMIG